MISPASAHTRPAAADRLAAAGWTPVNGADWLSPTGQGPHSYPVALLLADLPRVRHETPEPPASILAAERRWGRGRAVTPARLAELADLLETQGLSQSRAAERLGLSLSMVQGMWARVRKSRRLESGVGR